MMRDVEARSGNGLILDLDLMDWSYSVPIIDSFADRVLGHEKYGNT